MVRTNFAYSFVSFFSDLSLNMIVPTEGADFGFVLSMLLVWLMANIPTIVLSVIYIACREKFKKNKQLNKMNIQDLG